MSYFVEHPEGYTPRIFATTGNQVFELLKNGCVVERPHLPNGLDFDWWYIKTDSWHGITFSREPIPLPTVPQEVWDALKAADVDIEKLTGANDGLLSDSSRDVAP